MIRRLRRMGLFQCVTYPVCWSSKMAINMCVKLLIFVNKRITGRVPEAVTDEVYKVCNSQNAAEEGLTAAPGIENNNLEFVTIERERSYDLEQQIRQVENDCIKKDEQVQKLAGQVEEKKQTLERLGITLQEKTARIERLEGELRATREQIERLEVELQQRACNAERDGALARSEGTVSDASLHSSEDGWVGGVTPLVRQQGFPAYSSERDDLPPRRESTLSEKTENAHTLDSELRKEIERLKFDLERITTERDVARLGNAQSERSTHVHSQERDLRKEIDRLKDELEKCTAERDDAMTRLSQVVALRVRDNNPDIADLGDALRAEKLAELSNSIYDNDWMDAYDDLPETYTDEERIALLLDVVMRCFSICNELGSEQLNYVHKWMLSDQDDDSSRSTQKLLKDARKRKALQSLPEVEQRCVSKMQQEVNIFRDEDASSLDNLNNYVKACVKLCWMMSVQDPPCIFVCPGWSRGRASSQCDDQGRSTLVRIDGVQIGGVQNDSALNDEGGAAVRERRGLSLEGGASASERLVFDKAVFNDYTQRGRYIEYIVWPYMRLHEGGQILTKGVAQCCN